MNGKADANFQLAPEDTRRRERKSIRRRMTSRGICILVVAVLLQVSGNARAQLVSPVKVELLQRFKELIYTGQTLAHADEVAAGISDPFVYVEVGSGELPVSYYHFLVRADRLSAFTDAIALPPGLVLAPVSIVEGTQARYYLTISVYEVGGERSGLRAEWVTYVLAEGDDRPRLLMIETATSEASLNPVELQADPTERFEYERRGDTLITEVVSATSAFSASIKLPNLPLKSRLLDRRWGAASDVVYWRNGVTDLQNVNGLLANRRMLWIPKSSVQVDDRSHWAAYAESQPEWVLLYDHRIDVAVRPWTNADDPELPLDPVFRDELLETKATVFSTLEMERAEAIDERMAEPLADFVLEGAPPAIFLNFEILPDRLEHFAASIPLPRGFKLAPIEPYNGIGKRYFLSLNVYLAGGLAPGYRAEWSVYTTKEGDPRPQFMIVEAQTSGFSIDPVDVITRPAEVFEYAFSDAGALSINIRSPDTTFQAHIPLPEELDQRELNLSWAECNNLVYWRNGVADKVYYNGSAYENVSLVPTAGVEIEDGTRFADYVRLDHIFIYEQPQVFVVSPWNNLNELQGTEVTGRRPSRGRPGK
jgi:hypothetical protein